MAEPLDQATMDAIAEMLRDAETLPRPPLPMAILLLSVELEIMIAVNRAVDDMRQTASTD